MHIAMFSIVPYEKGDLFLRNRCPVTSTIPLLLQQLENHPHPVIDMKLDRVKTFMERLGNPERNVPPVIHIAGTNGKGSTVANLKSMLEAHGKTVHTYTSPHLVHFNERITICGKPITDALLAHVLQTVLEASQTFPITWFESTTAAAFLAFASVPADILLLETGLGGRLDATNIIDQPLLTAIAPISMDHEQFLGTTLAAIAAEKAGIIKSGVPCVVAKQMPIVHETIAAIAQKQQAALWRHGEEWQAILQSHTVDYHADSFVCDHITPSLQGIHQLENAAFAVSCMDKLQQLGFLTLSPEAIRHGISRTTWHARLQPITEGILAQLLPPHCALWLDGGHNPDAANMIAAWLSTRTPSKTHLIIGMMEGREAVSFLAPLAPHCASITTLTIPHQKTPQSATTLAIAAQQLGHEAYAATSIKNAIQHVISDIKHGEEILICGSLYLAGAVLAENAGVELSD